jgi:polar amino acid transport system substrate-binding protein
VVDDTLRELEKSGEAEKLFFKWYGNDSKIKFQVRPFKIESDKVDS